MNLIVCRVTSARCARSRRFQDDIAVRRRVTSSDQPDGLGHALLEIDVGLVGQRDFTEGFREAGHGFLGVGAHELVRLPDPADLENGCQQVRRPAPWESPASAQDRPSRFPANRETPSPRSPACWCGGFGLTNQAARSEVAVWIWPAIFPLPPVSSIRIQDGRCGCIDCRNREGGTWYTDLKTREKWKGSLNPSAAATDFTVARFPTGF